MGRLQCTDLHARSKEVLAWARLTVDEGRRLFPLFAAAFQAHLGEWRIERQLRPARRYTTDREGRGKVEPHFPAGLDHDIAEVVGIKQDQDLDTPWTLEFPNEVRNQLRRVAEGRVRGLGVPWFDVEPDPPGNDVVTADQESIDLLMSTDIRVGHRVLHLGHRVQVFPPA
jgi:hypothetical protein